MDKSLKTGQQTFHDNKNVEESNTKKVEEKLSSKHLNISDDKSDKRDDSSHNVSVTQNLAVTFSSTLSVSNRFLYIFIQNC